MNPAPRLGAGTLAAYGALGLPLAFAALPIYLYVPRFYADLGLSLSAAGAILVTARLADAFIDPWLGATADRARSPRRIIAWALPLLALGVVGLFHPPAGFAPGPWLAAALVPATLGYSAAGIAYQAWGARLGEPADRARVTAAREGAGLAGVMLAAALPQVFAPTVTAGLAPTALLFPLLLAIAALSTLGLTPDAARTPLTSGGGLGQALTSRRVRALLRVFALNGIASAVPATLFLFFVADRLQLAGSANLLLALYFISAALALPAWVGLAARIGKARAWRAGMLLAVAAFVWAFFLAPGDLPAFACITAVTGAALGADLALPAALLADTIEADAAAGHEGAYFGLWNFVNKLNLALAAGLALPLVEWLGYRPGLPAEGFALPIAYCLLPCLLKLAAIAALARLDCGHSIPNEAPR